MAEPLGKRETRELLTRHGFRPTKHLGQHFLVEPNVVARIVEIAVLGREAQVIEIGAGAGTLTRALAATGARVIAYEIDDSLRPVLAETVGDAADIRYDDAARVDWGVALPPGEWVVVANLPYNVGTPLVLDLLRWVPRITRLVVMLQREAIDRLAASPGSKIYGLPSVVVGLHGVVRIALRVPPHLFLPPPKVESAVAVIERRPADLAAEAAIALAAAGFAQRRKMIRSSLRSLLDDPEGTIAAAGLDATARAEDLAPGDWLRLAGAA
ncbi:MAG: ribosomal RNA small subunit methyltransferase A [Actinobacteria bacterium RBG_16_68_21]|nr:MAG: ribosomal RNA small subunit methyltransferase A [Actinobacteria bacterium RBG_16_68_21]